MTFQKDVMIDGDSPILFKVGSLGERYWAWIHQVSVQRTVSSFVVSALRRDTSSFPIGLP